MKNRPIIVLSNNDGCAIARSDEAKLLGIDMGTPAFMLEELIRKHDIAVFSSNYTLYGDMSDRVMKTLSTFCSQMEIYSIDEAYLDLHNMPHQDLLELGMRLRKTVIRNTGIPVTVGIAQTKTLAKMANRYAKKKFKHLGVYWAANQQMQNEMLQQTAVADICGIGHRYALLLQTSGFKTAADFAHAPDEWVRLNMSVVGQRLLSELKGTPAIEWEFEAPQKKNIAHTRAFGTPLTRKEDIMEAVANYAANCALKLRQQKSHCKSMTVFLQTNPHKTDAPQYMKSVNIELATATNDTAEIIKYASNGIDLVYKAGIHFMKAGIIVSDLVDENVLQQNIFDTQDRKRTKLIMSAMDEVNKSLGKETVRMAVQGFSKSYRLKAEHLSQRYTTKIDQILKVS